MVISYKSIYFPYERKLWYWTTNTKASSPGLLGCDAV